MSRLSTSDKETSEPKTASSSESIESRNGTKGEHGPTDAADATGTHGSSANQETSGTENAAAEATSLDRVEELMDQIGKKVGSFTSTLGQHLFRLAAHAREAAEDCWAEAQSIRRGESQQEEQEKQEEKPPTS